MTKEGETAPIVGVAAAGVVNDGTAMANCRSPKNGAGAKDGVSAKDARDTMPAPAPKLIKAEDRDEEVEDSSRKKGGEEREAPTATSMKPPSQSSSNISSKPSPTTQKTKVREHPSPQHHTPYMQDGYRPYHQPPPHARGPYPPHPGIHGGGPGAYPHPPPHYYGGAHPPPHDHYRGHPPPHYHQMPPLPGHGPPGHYHNGPHFNSHPPHMHGRPGPPPPGYHPGYGGGGPGHGHSGYPPHHHGNPHHPHHGFHQGNHQQQQHHPQHSYNHGGSSSTTTAHGASDASSIASSKSKRSIKSQSSQNGSCKKRTIEGVHDKNNSGSNGGSNNNANDANNNNNNNPGYRKTGSGSSTSLKEKAIPLSYSFRRTNSSSSSTTTITSGKNTSSNNNSTINADAMEIDSPRKIRDQLSSRSSTLPPLPHSSSGNNIFEDPMSDTAHIHNHRRTHSSTSTASSLSVGGFSLPSYDGPNKEDGMMDDAPMLKASPKRRKGENSAPLAMETSSSNVRSIFKRKGARRMANASDLSIEGAETSRFELLNMNDSDHEGKKDDDANSQNLFLALSTSPINQQAFDKTPMSKNTKKKRGPKITVKTDMDETAAKPSPTGTRKPPLETPTPPIPGSQTELMTDEHTLNQHLRGQSFTPLPHAGDSGISPSNMGFKLAPSMSWSIAGDTPSLEDLAACSWEESIRSVDKKRPDSTTSQMSRGLAISPHNFSLWRDEHEAKKADDGDEDHKDDGESVRLSILSPNSEIAGMAMDGTGGTTTPLPLFFRENGSDERENHHDQKKPADIKMDTKEGQMHRGHPGYGSRPSYPHGPRFFPNHGPPRNDGLPPTPIYSGSKPPTPHGFHPNMGFARSPMHGDRRDYGMYGHPPPSHGPNDRIRNLRGRMPHGVHMPPMPIHIPPPMSSHHPLTSPMCMPGGKPFWSPSHGMPSPHHMSPMDITQSKRKCIPMKPPIPSKFQGDMEKYKDAVVPEFTSLVNFPAHMSQKQAVNLPEGMRCCVMCGQACPCSSGNKKKNGPGDQKVSRGDIMGDKSGYAIIPTQNKGLCTLCDVNVWAVANSGLEIKWCKGCKNFRPWAAFGDKGLATKCLRCRERQREKYALQKEEKEKARRCKTAAATASIKA